MPTLFVLIAFALLTHEDCITSMIKRADASIYILVMRCLGYGNENLLLVYALTYQIYRVIQ